MAILYDKYGPETVVSVYDQKTGMRGVLVIDNTVLGPGKGGIRMTADVTEEEVLRLARTMTWKNSLAGIPFGGAKAGLVIPRGISPREKKKLVAAFARKIKPFIPTLYIGGPDVNSGEKEMAWIADETGIWEAVTGKPSGYCKKNRGKGKSCGIPHEFGSTGFGVAHAAKTAAKLLGMDIKGATVAIHGFGNVGTFAAKFLVSWGARVIALADVKGAVVKKDGFDSEKMEKAARKKFYVQDAFPESAVSDKDFWSSGADILIPASVTDVIHDGNKNFINSKIIVEGGNIPMRENIEEELRLKKNIIIVPDFVANAGGVISSYAEYMGYSPEKMFRIVEEKIVDATTKVIKESLRTKDNPRKVAMRLAESRVKKAMP